jgi:cytochrome c
LRGVKSMQPIAPRLIGVKPPRDRDRGGRRIGKLRVVRIVARGRFRRLWRPCRPHAIRPPFRSTLEDNAMKKLMMAALTAAGILLAGAANADEALAKKADCLKCHAVDKKKMGPALKTAAAKFKGQKDAEAALVASVKSNKEHPEIKASDADLAAIAKWILSL